MKMEIGREGNSFMDFLAFDVVSKSIWLINICETTMSDKLGGRGENTENVRLTNRQCEIF